VAVIVPPILYTRAALTGPIFFLDRPANDENINEDDMKNAADVESTTKPHVYNSLWQYSYYNYYYYSTYILGRFLNTYQGLAEPTTTFSNNNIIKNNFSSECVDVSL